MTIDEIKEAVKGDSTLLDGLVEYSIATDKGKEVLGNHASIEFEKKIGTRIGKVYSDMDADVKTILGDEKKSDQKSYDHLKDLWEELKVLRAKGDGGDEALKVEITSLKEKLKTDNGKHWHDLYTKGLKEWGDDKKEFETTIDGLKGNVRTTIVQSEIAKGIAGIKLNTNIPQAAQKAILDIAISDISKNAKVVDGKVVLQKMGESGTLEPWTNSSYSPISASDALKEILKESLDVKPDTGGGASTDAKFGKLATVGTGENAKKYVSLDKSKVTTKEQFTEAFDDALVELGVGRGTKEWFKLEAETIERMGVAKLPTN